MYVRNIANLRILEFSNFQILEFSNYFLPSNNIHFSLQYHTKLLIDTFNNIM